MNTSLAHALLLTLIPLAAANPASALDQCQNCLGGADAYASAPNSTCPGAAVTISVSVANAPCLMNAIEPIGVECQSGPPCNATVVRTWTNVTPGSQMSFCIRLGSGQRLCLDTDPNTPGVQGPSTGTGTGHDDRYSFVPCDSGVQQFSITAPCGSSGGLLTATADVECVDMCS